VVKELVGDNRPDQNRGNDCEIADERAPIVVGEVRRELQTAQEEGEPRRSDAHHETEACAGHI
jgi:hypothetical protein